MNHGINITCPNGIPWNVATDPYDAVAYEWGWKNSIVIARNALDRVFRGIYVQGVTGYRTRILLNNVSLLNDAVLSPAAAQRGIHVVGHTSAANTLTQCVVAGNVLSGAGTHTNESMVFLGGNLGLHSPSVACNRLNSGYKGFEINSVNKPSNVPGLLWRTNDMYPMAQGLVLSDGGEMGQQGDPTTSSSNLWYGSWTGSHTYVDAASNATFSVLYVKSCAACTPSLNGGPITSHRYAQVGNLMPVNAGGGDHNCYNEPNGIATPYPSDEDYYSSDMAYIAKTANYRFLHFNDSVRNSDAVHSDFYDGLEGSSIDKFMQIEQLLHDGSYSSALSILAGIEATVNVESNYVSYYTLYANYLSGHGILSEADSIALYELCLLCPGYDGACVYQARSLYNSIYNQIIDGENCQVDESSARKANIKEKSGAIGDPVKKWSVHVFPNPAFNQLTISSTEISEALFVEIYDVSGRILQNQILRTVHHQCNINFQLDNGIYFLSVTNKYNEKITKKIVVSR